MAQLSTTLRLEKPVVLSSILEPSKGIPYAAKTKIIASLGPKSREIEVIEKLLKAGMSVARFDFSWAGDRYYQESLENLKIASAKAEKLCAVMLDTNGPQLQVLNKTEKELVMEKDKEVTLTSDTSVIASPTILPTNYPDLWKCVSPGDMIYIGQYLFIGNEQTTICQLEVIKIIGQNVQCQIKNDAQLIGFVFTAHPSRIHLNLPTLNDVDKEAISKWGVRNDLDILSLSWTRNAEDVKMVRGFLSKLGDLHQTQIFAKIASLEALKNFDEILKEADGIILSRGSLGIDHPPEQMFLFQKAAIFKCNMAGKPIIVSRVVDSMTETPRPTRAEATDVANAVLDGADGFLLGAETLKGPYPVETITTIGRICAEAEKVYNQLEHTKRTLRFVGEPMDHLESMISSAVRVASKMKAALVIVFTTTGRAARLVAKYRPPMPTLVIVIPKLQQKGIHWCFSGQFLARQCLAIRGLFPVLVHAKKPVLKVNLFESDDGADFLAASPQTTLISEAIGDPKSEVNELILTLAIKHAKKIGLLKLDDQFVVCQKIVDSSVVRIMTYMEEKPLVVEENKEGEGEKDEEGKKPKEKLPTVDVEEKELEDDAIKCGIHRVMEVEEEEWVPPPSGFRCPVHKVIETEEPRVQVNLMVVPQEY